LFYLIPTLVYEAGRTDLHFIECFLWMPSVFRSVLGWDLLLQFLIVSRDLHFFPLGIGSSTPSQLLSMQLLLKEVSWTSIFVYVSAACPSTANSANLLCAVPRKCHLPPIQKTTVSNINKQFYNSVVGTCESKTAVRRKESTDYISTFRFSLGFCVFLLSKTIS
jgi:hypothetical protein